MNEVRIAANQQSIQSEPLTDPGSQDEPDCKGDSQRVKDLLSVVDDINAKLWYDWRESRWDPDKEWDGAETLADIAQLLIDHELAPKPILDDNAEDPDDSTPCPSCGRNDCDSPYLTGCGEKAN